MLIDSHKKVVLVAFVLFFLFDAILIFSFGESAVTEFVCAVIGNLVLPLICLSFAAGAVCFLFSAIGICITAMRNLTTLEANIKAKGILAACASCVKDLENEQGFEWHGLNTAPRHLYNRLRALGVEREIVKNADRREVPGLQDLHELTMQSELSRTCSSGMNTIISFLLILGILGTLTGVHGVIQESVNDVSQLAPALEPSQWAVGFTVFLLLLRGVYLCMVDRYVYRLDKLTADCLRPALSPGKSEDSESEQALQKMELTLQTISSNSRSPMNVTPFDDFSQISKDLKAGLGKAESNLQICLGRSLPPAAQEKKTEKKRKSKKSAQKKEANPEGKEKATTEQETKPDEEKSTDTLKNNVLRGKDAAAVEKDKPKPKKEKREPVNWDAAAVAEQIKTMDAKAADALRAMIQWVNVRREDTEQTAEDRALICSVLQQLHRGIPSEADLKKAQSHLRRGITSPRDMDELIDLLKARGSQDDHRYAAAAAAVSGSQL